MGPASGEHPQGEAGGSRGYAASEWQREGCRRRPRPRARKAGFSWQDPPCPGGSVCPGCVPVSPVEHEGLGSASKGQVGVNRRLDGSSYEGCSQGGWGLQGPLLITFSSSRASENPLCAPRRSPPPCQAPPYKACSPVISHFLPYLGDKPLF